MNITLSDEVLVGLQRLADFLDEPLTSDPRDLLVLVALGRHVADGGLWFPAGQHKTLTDLEAQLDLWARAEVDRRLGNRERFDR